MCGHVWNVFVYRTRWASKTVMLKVKRRWRLRFFSAARVYRGFTLALVTNAQPSFPKRRLRPNGNDNEPPRYQPNEPVPIARAKDKRRVFFLAAQRVTCVSALVSFSTRYSISRSLSRRCSESLIDPNSPVLCVLRSPLRVANVCARARYNKTSLHIESEKFRITFRPCDKVQMLLVHAACVSRSVNYNVRTDRSTCE
jgi:hypothetical protein